MTPKPDVFLTVNDGNEEWTRHIKGVDCANEAAHTPMPRGYAAAADEATRLARTHQQEPCSGCGRFAIWKRRVSRRDT